MKPSDYVFMSSVRPPEDDTELGTVSEPGSTVKSNYGKFKANAYESGELGV